MNIESLEMPISVGLEMGFEEIEFRLAEGSGLSPGISTLTLPGRARSSFDSYICFVLVFCYKMYSNMTFPSVYFPNFLHNLLHKKCTIILGQGPYINSVLLAHLTARLIS